MDIDNIIADEDRLREIGESIRSQWAKEDTPVSEKQSLGRWIYEMQPVIYLATGMIRNYILKWEPAERA